MKIFTVIFCLVTSACVHSTVVPFVSHHEMKSSPERNPEQVEIYRSQRPLENLKELGLITMTAGALSMPDIFETLRTDAAKQGADAVYDVKVKSERHVVRQTVQKCSPVTNCSTGTCTTTQKCRPETETKVVTTYTVQGSLMRRVQ